jgi:hypothetical protein
MATRGKRRNRNSAAMQSAVEAIRNEEMGLLKASKIFKFPRSNLENYVYHRTK